MLFSHWVFIAPENHTDTLASNIWPGVHLSRAVSSSFASSAAPESPSVTAPAPEAASVEATPVLASKPSWQGGTWKLL